MIITPGLVATSENLSHHVTFGTNVENVARFTIDDQTGHIMSLEFTKHISVKALYRNLLSVRDIRTLFLHCSLVTPNQQLKQSFQTFASLCGRDQTRDITNFTSFEG